ncbi:hypothetical protein ISCGN_001092 [Ixodes scapularis]
MGTIYRSGRRADDPLRLLHWLQGSCSVRGPYENLWSAARYAAVRGSGGVSSSREVAKGRSGVRLEKITTDATGVAASSRSTISAAASSVSSGLHGDVQYTVGSVDTSHSLRSIPHGRRTSPSASTSGRASLHVQEIRADIQFVARDQRECHFITYRCLFQALSSPFEWFQRFDL